MWNYNEKVMEHFLHPRNVGEIENPDAVGEVGNITCGDALRLTLKIDRESERILDAKFQTFGCASAIASSSVLTEIIKGKKLDEVSKITNKDIVNVLGELPEEKMHCSVMGMEALQAAIANYRGENLSKHEEEEEEGRLVCKCFGVTDSKIRKVALQNRLHTVEQITNYTKAGGACGACIDEIQEILDELWKEKPCSKDENKTGFKCMTVVQKIMRIQEVLDKEVKPLLQNDGGSVELVDIQDMKVIVRMQGRCSSCPVSHVTLKNTIEAKLREFVCPEITVEEAK
ncbi:MAG TPA: Fe-S cluster assembly protein NifU [Victivallales bacterium]|nr:Fe-S cluster assembly protein NifU [Victivallales bacterium]HPO89760.1 Fe-S cluster assembly protein NifU [Victivallales bacterium]HRR28134.1 Fe-S cluster assembly protein NifU [Victivallales bacterium]HRU00299.1 Fe-S cluster assembly protein NifU [Victivallales bacterium]